MLKLSKRSIVMGMEQIDRQHLKYFRFVSALMERLEQNTSPATLFKELNAYSRQHSDYEEKCMKKCGYPEVRTRAHKQQHVYFKQQMAQFSKMLVVDKVRLDAKLKRKLSYLLIDWFVNHIQYKDRDLCQYIIEHSVANNGLLDKIKVKAYGLHAKYG